MPEAVEDICAAVRENPFLLNDWAEQCPPQALLAGVLNEAVVWGSVPQERRLLVQAAAQMLSAVRAGIRGDELRTQPAAKAWLENHDAAASQTAWDELRRLAAAEAVHEVRKDLSQCEALMSEFAAEMRPADARLTSAVLGLQQRAAQLPDGPLSGSTGDREGRAWLAARMASAYLDGNEKLSSALRAAVQALGPEG